MDTAHGRIPIKVVTPSQRSKTANETALQRRGELGRQVNSVEMSIFYGESEFDRIKVIGALGGEVERQVVKVGRRHKAIADEMMMEIDVGERLSELANDGARGKRSADTRQLADRFFLRRPTTLCCGGCLDSETHQTFCCDAPDRVETRDKRKQQNQVCG